MTEININNFLNKELNLSENVYTDSLEEIQRNSVSGLFLRFLHRDTLDSRQLCRNIEDEIIALTDRDALTDEQKATAIGNLAAMQKKFHTSKLYGKAKDCTDTIERTIRLILKPVKKPTPQIKTQSHSQRVRQASDSSPQVPPLVIPPKQTPVSTPRPTINNAPIIATEAQKPKATVDKTTAASSSVNESGKNTAPSPIQAPSKSNPPPVKEEPAPVRPSSQPIKNNESKSTKKQTHGKQRQQKHVKQLKWNFGTDQEDIQTPPTILVPNIANKSISSSQSTIKNPGATTDEMAHAASRIARVRAEARAKAEAEAKARTESNPVSINKSSK